MGGFRLELLDALTMFVEPVGVVGDLAFDAGELFVLTGEMLTMIFQRLFDVVEPAVNPLEMPGHEVEAGVDTAELSLNG